MTTFAHRVDGFETVLHITHFEWHGIRHATAYSPGQKLLIPAEAPLENEKTTPQGNKDSIVEEIERRGITHVLFQGYSENMDQLLLFLRAKFGDSLWIGVINHVTVGQFDNSFEMHMLALLFTRKAYGLIDAIASVKPNFGQVFPAVWDKLIYNYAPNIPPATFAKDSEIAAVYTPLDTGWRKNMFTNILAGLAAKNVDEVACTNFPHGLESITDLRRLRLVGYLRGPDLLVKMARCRLVLLATFAECQPMTQLEALAVGTPSMTRDLALDGFAEDPLSKLCTTTALDDPATLARDIERVIDASRDPAYIQEMIDDHLARRHQLASERYAALLGL